MVRPCSCPPASNAVAETLKTAVAVVGIDIGKNSFHIVGLDERGAIALRQMVAWPVGIPICQRAALPHRHGGLRRRRAHHVNRRFRALGHDARLTPPKYVRPYSEEQNNDFRDAQAIAEGVQRPTSRRFTACVSDWSASAPVSSTRFLLERGIAMRFRFLRAQLSGVLATRSDALLPRMVRVIEDLAGDWLDEQIEGLSCKIETLARRDTGCERLMSVPGIGRSSPARGWQRSALEMRPQRPRLRRLAGARSEADLDPERRTRIRSYPCQGSLGVARQGHARRTDQSII